MMAAAASPARRTPASVDATATASGGEEAVRERVASRVTGAPIPRKPAALTGNAVIGTLRCRVCGEQTMAPCEAWTTPTTVIR